MTSLQISFSMFDTSICSIHLLHILTKIPSKSFVNVILKMSFIVAIVNSHVLESFITQEIYHNLSSNCSTTTFSFDTFSSFMHMECKRDKLVSLSTPIYLNSLVRILTTSCLSLVSSISKIKQRDYQPLFKSDVITFKRTLAIKSFISKVDLSKIQTKRSIKES